MDSGAEGLAQVLGLFRTRGSQTRADVIAATGMARSTVNQRLEALLSAGLLCSAGENASTGGRRAERFAFDADAGRLLVADIGASGLRTALCDLGGRVLAERTEEIPVTRGPEPVLKAVDEHFARLPLPRTGPGGGPALRGVAVSVPGPVEFEAGRAVSPPIMLGWDGFDIAGHVRRRYGVTALVDNDVNVMAFGEHRAGPPGVGHLFMLKVGTGVGSGIIADGRILRGAQGAAGDIGHLPARLEEPPSPGAEPALCRCGNVGCVEAYAGGWAFARDLFPGLADEETVNAVPEALRLLRSGDHHAIRLARRSGRILGEAVAGAVSLLNPAVVVVGGQFALTGEHVLTGIREVVYRRSLPLATRSLVIRPAALGKRSGVIGLAQQLADALFAPSGIAELLPRG
ncbi:ROK family protein [Marinitenerispora sediminis]|uniref:Sugar kinase n=1 Tax=Marinitenerispora sediminis TaxID=1931232 RepID=A0A368SY80_9ACTN|nr:ROK family protein [Marinitenerispora sediminis]RCV47547.1 sugar kinase [Marinitenerispora sediminis]RCV48945.1 sugar kinase [Marinitenerispora sediminis]RCV52134.1 sugar kinase [Marinitenerispora sediminis]